MKTTKKIVSILLALAMVLSLATTAFAEDGEATPATYSITINNDAEGHTYEAYQIFVGDLSVTTDENGKEVKVLSNVKWGKNAKQTGVVAEEILEDLTAEEAISYVDMSTDPAGTSTVVDGQYVIAGLAPGYYLVKDQNGSLNGDNDSYTQYILKVVADVTATPKSDVPEVEKKVDDENDSNTNEDATDWEDSADHDIGDHVPFQLKATLADNVEDYLKYKIVFHDTMSKGLTYDEGSYKVYLGNDPATRTEVTSHFQINVGEYSATEGTKISFTCENVKAFGATNSSVIVVEFTATLNEYANIGAAGNPNEVYLEYSNNPNWGWDKWEDKDDDDKWDEGETPENPDNPDNPNGDETGNTPKDKVIVFTYKVIVNKVDQDKAPLKGATFTMYKKLSAQPAEDSDVNYITETKNDVVTYWQIIGEIKGEEISTFEWIGLDDGDYKLVETVTPAGYNTIDPIEFTISATHEEESDDPKLLTLSGGDKFTGNVDVGTLTGEVVNNAGTVLPETGGVGTTIFYILGAVLMLGTAVVLVARKRMSANA